MKEDNGIEEADEEPEAAEESEGEDAGPKKENIFLAGRLYREDIELPRDLDEGPASDGEERPTKYKTKCVNCDVADLDRCERRGELLFFENNLLAYLKSYIYS